ncbi:MAG: ABC transporter substrate-binding protein [Desulfobacterium sp.]
MALFWLDGNIEPTEGWNGWTLTRSGIGENLIQIDENLKYKGVIGEDWKQVDELTTVFQIRKGITFHNGTPVDALACKASIERALAITDRKDVQFPLDNITAQGDQLTIKTLKPYATLLNVLADPVFIIVDASAAAKDPEGFKVKPITTGAFKVISFSSDTGLILKKYAGYWKGEPGVDIVNVKYISDASTRTMALQSGELDLATQIGARDLTLFENDDRFRVYKGPNLRIFLLRINMERPYMKNSVFRQALMHGINKDIYATKLAGGIPARGPFNSLLPFGYKGDEYYTYDPAKAKTLLDKEGFVDGDGDGIREMNGKNIVLKYVCMTNHGKNAKNIGIAMQSQYKKIGIGLKVFQFENFNEIAKKGDFDFLYERWTSAPTADPQYFLEASFKTGGRGNYGHYSNPQLDGVCETLKNTMDKAKRDKLGMEGTRILMEDTASIFLYYGQGNVVTSRNVDGVYRFISEIYYIDDRVKIK